ESALYGSDQLLRDSLRADERRRRVRRILFITLCLGGIAMGTVVLAFFAGWLTLAAPPPKDSKAANSTAGKEKLSEEARVEKGDALARQGWELWKKQQYDQAAKKFEAAVKLDPDSANAWNGLGWARFNGGKGETALEAFEKCISLEPDHPAG